MCRPWYSGGTVAVVYTGGSEYDMFPESTSERFEDGTVNFATMMGVVIGLDYLLSIGMDKIEQHVCSFPAWLLQRLAILKHGNGEHLVC
jgi:molybdenum cofactor sulfurtransferase